MARVEEEVVITMTFGHQGIGRAMLVTAQLSLGWSIHDTQIAMMRFQGEDGRAWKSIARRLTGTD